MAIAPGAAYGGAKRWPATSFAAVVDGLARDGVAAVLIGGAGDRGAGHELTAAAVSSPFDLIARTDLRVLGGVLANCSGLVIAACAASLSTACSRRQGRRRD